MPDTHINQYKFMKHNFLIAAALVIAATACTKKQLNTEADNPQATAELTVSLPQVITRASDEVDGGVNCFQVFVFREDNKLEASSWGEKTSQTLNLTKGIKKIAVLTNHDRINNVSDWEGLHSLTIDLSKNAPEALLMFGEVTEELSDDKSIVVDVTRLAARIELQTLTNAIALEPYKSQAMTLKRVFLINVAGERNIAGTLSSWKWYNLGDFFTGACDALLLNSTQKTLSAGVNTLDYAFYSYPNPGNEHPLRLVAEIELGSESWYYPVTIMNVEANKRYIVKGLKITRLGVTDPDQDIKFAEGTISIEVKPWTETEIEEVVI